MPQTMITMDSDMHKNCDLTHASKVQVPSRSCESSVGLSEKIPQGARVREKASPEPSLLINWFKPRPKPRKLILCVQCEERFPEEDLEKHMRNPCAPRIGTLSLRMTEGRNKLPREPPWKYCAQCDKRFIRKKDLNEHVKKHNAAPPACAAPHTESLPTTCRLCNQYFDEEKNLNEHMMIHAYGLKPSPKVEPLQINN